MGKLKILQTINLKKPPLTGEGKIFGKLQRLHSLDTLWVENFDEIALSRTVKEIFKMAALQRLHSLDTYFL